MPTNQDHPPSPSALPQVLVAQLGARNHYGVPDALVSRGMLAALYTDSYATSGLVGRAAPLLERLPISSLRRFLQRRSAVVPASRVVAFHGLGLRYYFRRRRARTQAQRLATHLWAGERFCQRVIRCRPQDFDVVYAYSSAALELLRYAREAGRWSVLDHGIGPLRFEQRLRATQAARYPEWAIEEALGPAGELYAERQRQEWAAADWIVCLSRFAAEAIRAEGGPVEKLRVLPRGVPLDFSPATERPDHRGPLRVLFIGGNSLQKGLPDLVAAVKLLPRGSVELRAVGVDGISAEGWNLARRVGDILGNVSRQETRQHYAWADVLVLPTVCDTFGLVILEAMASGLPVIVSTNCAAGDVVREGHDGFIVPIQSPERIADRLEILRSDRPAARHLGCNARQRAAEFSRDCEARRLVSLLCELPSGGLRTTLPVATTVQGG